MDQHFPEYRGRLEYICQNCRRRYPGEKLFYSCPDCGGVFLLQDANTAELAKTSPEQWQRLFSQRTSTDWHQLQGVFRYYELTAPVMEPEDIVYLGEGNTPVIPANKHLQAKVGQEFAFKNEGQNPSASFKDRGMACAFSFLKSLIRKNNWQRVLAICASTGDTSASAALYAAYIQDPITMVVLLPQGKTTPQQLSQPLGSGATVLEIPGVFDDCMRVVEYLSEHYPVALLNSKNSWRILGQETYAFEIAQGYAWDMGNKAIFVPIGNAGNISAIMAGFLKLFRLGIIQSLPKIIGVQSAHADPVFRFYHQDQADLQFNAVQVKSSVAQAAMIGNPVSFPRVRNLAAEYKQTAGEGSFQVVQVQEQEIIEAMLLANRNGHIACTQGGECLAGLQRAKKLGYIKEGELAVLNSTAHSLKFSNFQEMYFQNSFAPEYAIQPRQEFINQPVSIISDRQKENLGQDRFIQEVVQDIVDKLGI